MKKFWAEFKKFIAKGNIVDLALAVVIGSAFNKIVNSLVNDIIMPLISLAVGGADVSDWKWVIKPAEYDSAGTLITAESALKYGVFIQTIIDFLIIALTLFIVFKVFNYSKKKLNELGESVIEETKKYKDKLKKKKKGKVVEEVAETTIETKVEEAKVETPVVEEKAPEVNKDELMINLLTDIRDSLKSKK